MTMRTVYLFRYAGKRVPGGISIKPNVYEHMAKKVPDFPSSSVGELSEL